MNQIAPGVVHWSAKHPNLGMDVSSYWLTREGVVLDPMVPAQGLDPFDDSPPEHVLLTNRHHDRGAWTFRDRFGCTVHCVRPGLHELEGRGPVEAFDFGDELPGGIVAHEVGVICPDETALHIPEHRALAVADGVINYGELGFVPEQYMDEPQATKSGLKAAYARLLDLDLDFDILLMAHGEPVVGGAQDELRRFADVG